MKTYSLSFSYEGVFFEDYKENNTTKVTVVVCLTKLFLKWNGSATAVEGRRVFYVSLARYPET